MAEFDLAIVKPLRQPPPAAGGPEIPFQPAFFDPGMRLLPLLPLASWRRPYAEYLGRRLKQHPKDLITHVRRVLLRAAIGDRPGTYHACADLFYALEDKGFDLRQDMLNRVAHLLEPDQYALLQGLLRPQAGASCEQGLPSSWLKRKCESSQLVLSNRADRSPPAALSDPLAEARQYLDDGQVDEARALLEEVVLMHPHQIALSIELTEIYRHARDFVGLQRMRRNLGTLPTAVEAVWAKALASVSAE